MLKAGKIPKEQADPIIEQAYTNVLTNYSDCYVADYVAYHLAEMSVEKGDKVAAAGFYRIFLEKTNPKNNRTEFVKAKLAELEGTDR